MRIPRKLKAKKVSTHSGGHVTVHNGSHQTTRRVHVRVRLTGDV